MFDQLLENTILLFVAVDPIALVPIFASLTQGLHKDDIKKIYIQATIVSFFVQITPLAQDRLGLLGVAWWDAPPQHCRH